MKKINYFILILIMFLLGNTYVYADTNIVDFDKKGSIELTIITDDNEKIENVEISIYQVANATSVDNNLSFEYIESIKGCSANLDDLSNIDTLEELDKCIGDKLPTHKKTSNKEGKVTFDNLPLGLYLIKQTNTLENYSTIDPFLVIIPVNEDNSWVYNINPSPKINIIKLSDLIVEKVWNNKDINTPKSITVGLYEKDVLISKITLNEENNWIYVFKNIKESDFYSVKELDIPDGYKVSYRKENNKFIITNTKELPNTGTNLLLTTITLSFGLISIAIGILTNRKNNE